MRLRESGKPSLPRRNSGPKRMSFSATARGSTICPFAHGARPAVFLVAHHGATHVTSGEVGQSNYVVCDCTKNPEIVTGGQNTMRSLTENVHRNPKSYNGNVCDRGAKGNEDQWVRY